MRVDGETAVPLGRHRDENGNTMYYMDSGAFERRLENTLTEE